MIKNFDQLVQTLREKHLHRWVDFIFVEYGVEWLRSAWDAFQDIYNYYIGDLPTNDDEVVVHFVTMVNDALI